MKITRDFVGVCCGISYAQKTTEIPGFTTEKEKAE